MADDTLDAYDLPEDDDPGLLARRAKSAPFSLDDLPAIEHGRLGRPLSIGEGFGVDTAGGDRLRLDNLFQYRTHAGVLAGIPDDPWFNIEGAIERAGSIFPGHDAPPRVLTPTLHAGHRHVRERDGREYDESWRILPPITSLARFTASRAARDTGEPYSSIVLIWYQDRYGLPDDPRILDQIARLDWEAIAHHWSW